MNVESTWIPTCHWMDHVPWSLGLFWNNQLLEVGQTQNHWETMALWTLTTVGLFYLSCVRICTNRILLEWHLIEGPATYEFIINLRVCDHTTRFWRCLGMAFGHFLLGPHNIMVTALGSCVKWPLVWILSIVIYMWKGIHGGVLGVYNITSRSGLFHTTYKLTWLREGV